MLGSYKSQQNISTCSSSKSILNSQAEPAKQQVYIFTFYFDQNVVIPSVILTESIDPTIGLGVNRQGVRVRI